MEKTIGIPDGYEATLERCKQWVAGTSGLNPGASPKEVSEYIFPKLAESEDEKIRKEIIGFIIWATSRGSVRNDWLQKNRPAEWLAYLERQKEQKPAEWSEEDEKNLKLAYDLLVNGLEADRRYPELISWLKSLRPQPHWKPSEEQIVALARATNRCIGVDDAKILVKLLEQLEKL